MQMTWKIVCVTTTLSLMDWITQNFEEAQPSMSNSSPGEKENWLFHRSFSSKVCALVVYKNLDMNNNISSYNRLTTFGKKMYKPKPSCNNITITFTHDIVMAAN